MISNFFKSNLVSHNFSISINKVVYPGSKLNRNGICSKECFNGHFGSKISIKKCTHGFTHYLKEIKGVKIAIIEVVSDNIKMSKKHRNRKVSKIHAENWFNYVSRFSKEIEKSTLKKASDDFDKFHEVTKWCDQMHHYSSKILNKYGNTFKEAEKEAPNDVKSLYKCAVMLKDSLETTGIYFNPNAAKYGRKRTTDIYRMVDKIVRVVEHSEASSFNKKIRITGRVDKEYDIYESFKIIPLSLLQNAIKYSSSNEIKVRFEEFEGGLIMSVISTGNCISDEQLSKLFDRGYRTPWAKKLHHDGKGLGLFVSKIVADAHKLELSAKSRSLGYDYNDMPQAENVFFFKIVEK